MATSSWDEYARPTTPAWFNAPAISPATIVPWPSLSMQGLPPTKVFCPTICPVKSGSEQSTPESMTATFTGAANVGGVAHASNAWSWSRYHCFA